MLKWVAIPFSRGSSQPRDRTRVSYTAGRFFNNWAAREAPNVIISPIHSQVMKQWHRERENNGPTSRQRGKAWTRNQDSDSLAHCAIYLLRKMLNISLWFRNSNKELQLEVLFFFQVGFENTRFVIWIYLFLETLTKSEHPWWQFPSL